MTITQTITSIAPAANPATMDRATFSTTAAANVLGISNMTTELNTWAGQVNAISATAVGDVATAIGAAAASTPVDADKFAWREAAGGVLKSTTWANIKAMLFGGAAGANIASAATIDLTAATGNSPRITGTVATSAVTMNTGQWSLVVADGAWPLTYNATTNKITGGVDTVLSAGDQVLYHKDLSGVVSGIILRSIGTEIVTSYVGATAFTGSGTYSDQTSITLTAGRWCISIIAAVNKGASDATAAQFGIGTVAGNNSTGFVTGDTGFELVPIATVVASGAVPGWYVSVSVNTTFYLKRWALYTTGAPSSYGRITAKRLS